MQADHIGDLRHNERLERRGAASEKLFLPGDNLVPDGKQGLLALLKAPEKDSGPSDFSAQIEQQLLILSAPGQQILILFGNAKPG